MIDIIYSPDFRNSQRGDHCEWYTGISDTTSMIGFWFSRIPGSELQVLPT